MCEAVIKILTSLVDRVFSYVGYIFCCVLQGQRERKREWVGGERKRERGIKGKV